MSRFQISYWAHNAAPWRPFTGAIEAASAREAIERANPRAAGRYRVTFFGTDETAGLFRVSLTSHDDCQLVEVASFPREEADTRRRAPRRRP